MAANEREVKARTLLLSALEQGSECMLSNVIYDAANDGRTFPDGEGDTYVEDNGYDSDDLAHVLMELFKKKVS